jgi:hypothetical protein
MTMKPDLQGEERYPDFIAKLERADARQITLQVFGGTQPVQIQNGVWTLQPVTFIHFIIHEDAASSDDPFETRQFVWEIAKPFRSASEQNEYIDRIVANLRSKGFSVVEYSTNPR